MKNKFVKILSTGICCIMVAVVLSAYLPQSNKVELAVIPTYESSINELESIDPPFH